MHPKSSTNNSEQPQQQQAENSAAAAAGNNNGEKVHNHARVEKLPSKAKKRGRGRPKKKILTSKKAGKKQVQIQKRSRGRPKKAASKTVAAGLTRKTSSAVQHRIVQTSTPQLSEKQPVIAEIFAALLEKPPRKVMSTKRAVTEAERTAQIVKNVTEPDANFMCLDCNETFSNYKNLYAQQSHPSQFTGWP